MDIDSNLLKRLKKAYTVGALTGAGVSAASGIPVFRGKEGLWKTYRPEDLATFQAFNKNPKLVWEWYLWRRSLVGKAKPNLAHYSLVDFEEFFPDFYTITQNVDNLHQIAGSKKVVELHGNITRTKCSKCEQLYAGTVLLDAGIPKCKSCGALVRPDVVWFGETLPLEALEKAQEIAMQSEVFFSIGTSGIVEPAASLPYMAKGNGAFIVEINPEETQLSGIADTFLKGHAHEILPQIAIALKK